MARLIDAKELEKQVKAVFGESNPVLMGQMLRWIRKQTTFEGVPVVRCKDCKHFDTRYMECQCPYVSTDNEGGASYSLGFGPDDFCSYGERKEEKKEGKGRNGNDQDNQQPGI